MKNKDQKLKQFKKLCGAYKRNHEKQKALAERIRRLGLELGILTKSEDPENQNSSEVKGE